METIIVISNRKQYFFTKNHCQEHSLGDDFIAVTHYLPFLVVPRESLPSGQVNTKEDLVAVFYYDMQEIPNPDPEMQSEF